MIRAALHLHSTYSDGEFTLAELKELFANMGCRAMLPTDHAEYFDAERAQEYATECAELSDDGFLVIPGLEFGCHDRMHVLGYGVTALVDATDPSTVFEHIRSHGGVPVIAHPRDVHFEWIREMETLPDGIEGWNTKYDGRGAPRPATFRVIRELQERAPDLRAFYGLDLHWRHQFRQLVTVLEARDRLTAEAVLASLRAGDFHARSGRLSLPSDGVLTPTQEARFARVHRRSRRLKGLASRVKRLLDRAGIPTPARLKAQVRRLF